MRFGQFELDLAAGELYRDGRRVRLQEQPRQVLIALVGRPGDVVTREELRERLWKSDTFVDFEHGLNTAVKKVRQALGDSAETPRFIETLAKRGYRFIGEVQSVGPAGLVDSPPVPEAAVRNLPGRRWMTRPILLWAVGIIVASAVFATWFFRDHSNSLAVMPLRVLYQVSEPDRLVKVAGIKLA